MPTDAQIQMFFEITGTAMFAAIWIFCATHDLGMLGVIPLSLCGYVIYKAHLWVRRAKYNYIVQSEI